VLYNPVRFVPFPSIYVHSIALHSIPFQTAPGNFHQFHSTPLKLAGSMTAVWSLCCALLSHPVLSSPLQSPFIQSNPFP